MTECARIYTGSLYCVASSASLRSIIEKETRKHATNIECGGYAILCYEKTQNSGRNTKEDQQVGVCVCL